jgi:hypothetical protein
MGTKNSKRLVIDACILKASGDENVIHPTSKNCHNFLRSVLQISHRVVVTRAIEAEWNRHNSRYALAWRAKMEEKERFVFILKLENAELRDRIYLADVLLENITDNQRMEVKKDIHLIEAALATDKIVVSLDDNTARRFFTKAAKEVEELSELKAIAWVNPDKPEEKPIEWLKKGANLDPERLLGSIGKDLRIN